MSICKTILVSMEPDTTKPNVQFFQDDLAAFEGAKQIQGTFNRDVFVATIQHVIRADRRHCQADRPNDTRKHMLAQSEMLEPAFQRGMSYFDIEAMNEIEGRRPSSIKNG